MIRQIAILSAALLALVSSNALAHEGHDDDTLTERRAARLASKTLPTLVEAKKVSASWAKAMHDKVERRSLASQDIWIVSYKNSDAKAGDRLYLFFDEVGNFIEANHTGELSKK